MLLSLIVPCYNEQEALPLFYQETTKVLRKMQCDYELLLINDGSRDNTLSIMKELAAQDPHVLYFSFSRNFGKEAAMPAEIMSLSWMPIFRILRPFFRKW